MLGEAAGSRKIRLETTAWNSLDFTIPDNAGRQPMKRSIITGSLATLASTLPLEKFHTFLTDNRHEVSISDDAGRYLCNQIFFTALEFIRCHGIPCPAGFIHPPFASDYPTARAVDALDLLVREMMC